MNKVVLLCRPGFEKECAAEITDKAGKREIFGFARVKENAAMSFMNATSRKMAKS